MRTLPLPRPRPWLIALSADLSDGLPRPRRDLAFIPAEKAPAAEARLELPPLKEAA